MVDKLSALRSKAGLTLPNYGSTSGEDDDQDHADDLGGWGEGRTLMSTLIQTSNELLPMCDKLADCSAKVRELTKQAVNATSAEKEQKIGEAVDKTIDDGKAEMLKIKSLLDELKRIETEEHDMTPAEAQMCDSVIRSATLKFKANLTDYLKAQEDYKSAVKGKVERQLRIAYPDAREEEIQELADEDPLSVREAISQQLQKGGHHTLQEALRDLHDKYSDMKKLEESVVELHDLFLYLSALVDEQAKTLDSIEANVEKTAEYTGVAVEHLVVAKTHKESLEKKQFWFYAVFCGICVVATLALFACIAPYVSALKGLFGGGGDKGG